jgi:radical SAM superfamily enzyme YgiQ (UPF0313 family)
MCVFCNQSKITGKIEEQCVSETTKIIESYLKTIPSKSVVEVAFFGGSFTGIPFEKQKSYLKSVKKYIDDGRVTGIRISTRPDYISEEIINYLKENGVTTIELGVQSFDKKVMTIENITKNPNILPKKENGDFSQMYIEYRTVKDCIEKVYFAPKVRDKEMFNIQIKRFGLNIRSHESTHKIS